ncbi:hypothetical protein VTK26DRAFT_315 [Humicola hyalothermophila]
MGQLPVRGFRELIWLDLPPDASATAQGLCTDLAYRHRSGRTKKFEHHTDEFPCSAAATRVWLRCQTKPSFSPTSNDAPSAGLRTGLGRRAGRAHRQINLDIH